jgi:hypothetical protein
MAFLRKKTINGKSYYYLVENKRVNGRVVQRVLKYIGNERKMRQYRKG